MLWFRFTHLLSKLTRRNEGVLLLNFIDIWWALCERRWRISDSIIQWCSKTDFPEPKILLMVLCMFSQKLKLLYIYLEVVQFSWSCTKFYPTVFKTYKYDLKLDRKYRIKKEIYILAGDDRAFSWSLLWGRLQFFTAHLPGMDTKVKLDVM